MDHILQDKDIDAVDALLPVQFNLDTVKKAVAAGKPIAFEKPISSNVKDGAEIVKIAEKTEIPVFVLENFVYHNSVRQLKEVLPKVGKVATFTYTAYGPYAPSKYHSTGWRQKPQHVGGYLSDGGVHQLAILTEVLGEVESVSARTQQLKDVSGDVDTLNSLFNMKDGSYGTFLYGSYFGPCQKLCRFTILGTEGSIVYELELGKPATISVYHGDPHAKPEVLQVEADDVNGVVAEFANFKEAVAKKDKSLLKCTPRKAFHHFAIIAACVESGEKKGSLVDVFTP